MLARAESGFGGNDKPASMARLRRRRFYSWRPQNHKTRTDAQRFGSSSPGKMLKPIPPQSLHTAAKFTDEFACITFRFAGNLERDALYSGTFDDRERVSEALR